MNLNFWDTLAKKNKTPGYGDISYSFFDQQMRMLCTHRIISRFIDLNNRHDLRLLDYGCGRGEFLQHFSSDFSRLTGFDVSIEIIKISKKILKKYSNIFLTDNFDHISGEFDVAISVTVLQHILDDDELIRTLKIIRPFMKPNSIFLCLESVEEDRYRPAVPPHLRPRRLSRWIDIFAESGFIFESSFDFYNPSIIPTPSYHEYRKGTALLRFVYKAFLRMGLHLNCLPTKRHQRFFHGS